MVTYAHIFDIHPNSFIQKRSTQQCFLSTILQPVNQMRISLHSVISDKQSFISKILKVVRTLENKLKFFIPLGIQIEKDLSYINIRIKVQSLGALNDTQMTKI